MRIKRIIAVFSIVFILFSAGFGFNQLNASADIYDDYTNYYVLDIRAWLLGNGFGVDDLRVSTRFPTDFLPEDGILSIYFCDITVDIGYQYYNALCSVLDDSNVVPRSSISCVRIDANTVYIDLSGSTILVYIPVNFIDRSAVSENFEDTLFYLFPTMFFEVRSSDYSSVTYFPASAYIYVGDGYLGTPSIGSVPEDAYRTIGTSFKFGYDAGYGIGYDDGYNIGYGAGNSDGYNNGYNSGYDLGYDDGHSEGYNSGYTDGYTEGFQTDVYNMFSPSLGVYVSNGTLDIIEEGYDNFLALAKGNSFDDNLYYFSNGWLSIGGTASNKVNLYLKQGVTYTISFDAKWHSVGLTNNIRIYRYEKDNISSNSPTTAYFVSDEDFTRVVFTFEQNISGYFRFVIPLSSGSLYLKNIQINEGYNDVFRYNPFDVGYELGYSVGYNFGKEVGLQGSITTSWFAQFLDGFVRLLNIQIFPNITLGTIAGVSILLGFIAFLFRFKGGG